MKKKPEPEPIEPIEPETVDDAPKKPYTQSSWNGLPNYCCKYCPNATLNEDTAISHYLERHAPPPPPPPPKSTVFVADKNGRQIN